MNGNIKRNDNGKRQSGKRTNFMIIHNETYDLLAPDSVGLAVYMHMLRHSGSEYNVTIKNIARDIQHSPKAVNNAFIRLEEKGLLNHKYNRDLTGKSQIKTAGGNIVPNNTSQYTLNAVPIKPIVPVDVPTAIPGNVSILDMEFTAEEIESAVESAAYIPSYMEEYKPDPVQTVAMAEPVKAEVRAEKKTYDKQTAERRKQHIANIAAQNGLFGSNVNILIYWSKVFYKETGRIANDDCLQDMAFKLSGNSKENLTGYIDKKRREYSNE